MQSSEMKVYQQQVQPTAKFDKALQLIDGRTGFCAKESMVRTGQFSIMPFTNYDVRSIRTMDGNKTEIQCFIVVTSSEGFQQVVLPASVMDAIYRHRDSLIKDSKKERAKTAAATRQVRADAGYYESDEWKAKQEAQKQQPKKSKKAKRGSK